jgi:UMF1 family MFS transporter
MKYRRHKIITWSLYDFANTIFSMNVVSLNFPLMIKNDYNGADIALSLARSAAMIMVALSMPLAGIVADKFRRRMPLTILFNLSCCLATVLLGKGGSIIIQLGLFAIAIYSYQAALVFYDAILPQVAGPDRMGRVSGYGVAMGYIGTIFGLSVVGAMTCPGCYGRAFTWTGIFFFLFALPFFFTVRDEAPKPLAGLWRMTWESIKRLSDVYADAKSRPGVLRFFVGRFFVVEALETIIFFMGIFLNEAIGFSDRRAVFGNLNEITVFLLTVTVFTVLGSLVWGFVTERFGPRNSLLGTVALWVVTLMGIVFISHKAIFYVLGSLAGISLGGVWTTERPLLINLIADNEKLGGYFGLFALTGRMAAVIGPVIWGVTVALLGSLGVIKYRFAVATVLIMMFTGLVILRKVPDARQPAS